jgi:hypothetical protein
MSLLLCLASTCISCVSLTSTCLSTSAPVSDIDLLTSPRLLEQPHRVDDVEVSGRGGDSLCARGRVWGLRSVPRPSQVPQRHAISPRGWVRCPFFVTRDEPHCAVSLHSVLMCMCLKVFALLSMCASPLFPHCNPLLQSSTH